MADVPYGHALVPVVAAKTIGTSATQVYSVNQLVFNFLIQANTSNTGSIYIGSSSVDSTASIRITAGQSFSPDALYAGGTNLKQYDLSSWYLRASASGQKVSITKIVNKLQAISNPT